GDHLGGPYGHGADHGRGAPNGASDGRASGHHARARAVARVHEAVDPALRDPAGRLEDLSRSLARAELGRGDRRDVVRAGRGHRPARRRARSHRHAGTLRPADRRPDGRWGEEPLHHAVADLRRTRAGDPDVPRRGVPAAEGRRAPLRPDAVDGGKLEGRVALITGASRNIGRAIAPAMKERRRGSIIALGGMSSLTGRPNTAVVTVAKTGLLGLVRALAAELGPFGVRVNMVMPGFIDTERRHADWYPEFRQAPPGSPEELAKIPLRP